MHNPKDIMQAEAALAIEEAGGSGILAICTGGGKTKIAIDRLLKVNPDSILWVVPKRKLRDRTIPLEFKEWGATELLDKTVLTCYASLHNVESQHFDYIIFDEWHYITPNNAMFLANITFDHVLCLSATTPTEREKLNIMYNQLGLHIVYELELDEGVRKGIVAPYEIHVIRVPLDNAIRHVKAGSKSKPFYTTEAKNYEYLEKLEKKYDDNHEYLPDWFIFKRKRLISNSVAKANLAKKLLTHKIGKDERTLVFAGSIEQAKKLCPHTFHSKIDDRWYKAFVNERINTLSVVDSVNDGDNIPNLDSAIVVQINAKDRRLIQRIGRIVRYRPGHRARIYILIARGTQDEEWLKTATEGLDPSNIRYFKYGE